MQAVMSLAEHVYVLNQGRIIADGTPAAIAAMPAVIEAYLGHGAAARMGHGRRGGGAMSAALLDVEALHAGYGGVQVLHGVDLEVRDARDRRGARQQRRRQVDAEQQRLRPVPRHRRPACASTATTSPGRAPARIVADGSDPGAGGPPHLPEPDGAREPRARRLSPRPRAPRRSNLERIVAVFPRLRERFAQAAGTLSGGEQQMLAIGRGLMAEPRLLILDEPSLGLSPLLVEEMFALIRRLNEDGLAILLVEQNVVQSLELAARAYVMENGRIVLSGAARRAARGPGPQARISGNVGHEHRRRPHTVPPSAMADRARARSAPVSASPTCRARSSSARASCSPTASAPSPPARRSRR